MSGFGNVRQIHQKGAIDLVTEYDKRSAEVILTFLQREFPDHAILAEENGRKRWRETDAHGEAVTYEAVERTPPRRLKSRIATPDLPYGGTWTFELEGQDGETVVRITEDGEVYNPIFRFVGRFILGYESSIAGYLEDLEKAASKP